MTRRDALLAALSGVLLALSFSAFDLGFLAWISLAPLLLALRGKTPRQGFRLGGMTGLLAFGGTLSWISTSLHSYGRIPLITASVITLLLCLYCALYPALFGAIVARLRQTRPALVVAAAPAAWTGLELARATVLTGFPWALLGYTQHAVLPVIQIADITGVYGVTYLIVLANILVAELIEDRTRVIPAAAGCAIVIAVMVYGTVRMQQDNAAKGIQLSVVQGNIDQDKKWDPAYQAAVFSTYRRLTVKALDRKPDLVLWPETATPFYFDGVAASDVALTARLRTFVADSGTPLLFGSPRFERGTDRTYLLRNSAYLLDADGATAAIYHKMHLVPLGEYVPLKKSVLFFLEKLVTAGGDFQPGTDYTVMKVRNRESGRMCSVGTAICYEIIFPDLVRQFVDQGATVVTTITNDAWFGRSAAPYQHFSMAVFRAVENRVPVVRAANTGISGFIDAHGRVLEQSEIFTEAVLTKTVVPSDGTKTFYTRYGDVFACLCLLTSILLLAPFPMKKSVC